MTKSEITNYISVFRLMVENMNGLKNSAIYPIRTEAMDNFMKLGFPPGRHEEWKYTRIPKFFKEIPDVSIQKRKTEIDIDLSFFDGINANRIVFIDGFYSENASQILDDEIHHGFKSVKTAILEHDENFYEYFNSITDNKKQHFNALNTALAQDGLYLTIAAGSRIKHPVLLVNIVSGGMLYQSRNLIIAEANSECEVIEIVINKGELAYFNNVTEIFLKENSRLRNFMIQDEDNELCLINSREVLQNRDSFYNAVTISLNGKLIRNNLHVRLNDQNCQCDLNGLYYGKSSDLIDNHILIDHRKPNCLSNQLYKGLLDDKSEGVFNGKVYVRENAQKTNAYQSNQNILLSPNAGINTKPQLEIFADDVKCSHGATSGQLDDEAIFYLESRGLPREKARSLVSFAFANEIVEKVNNIELRESIRSTLLERLNLSL